VLALAGGLILSLAFPPAGAWPLAFVSLAPLVWGLRRTGPGVGAVLGLTFGLGFFGATLYWIWLFGAMAWTSLTLVSALYVAVFGAVAPSLLRRGHPIRSAIGVAALWTAVEWVRATWPLGGFSWGTLGVSQVDDRLLLPLATIAGVWGVSFVVVAVNVLVTEAVAHDGGAMARRAGRVALAAVLIVVPAAIPFARAEGPELHVASLQVDVRESSRPTRSDEDLAIARAHVDLHRSLADDPPDLVVWGEGALDPGALADPDTVAMVRDAVASIGVPTIVGAVADDPDGGQRTTVLALDGQGTQVDRYDKVQLVPFGEFVPWRSRLDWIEALEQIPVDRIPGERVHTIGLPGLPAIGTPICYENSFPRLPRGLVDDGAEILIVPVNNASYGSTAASAQHLQMSRMRAVETGRWVVNAAISGVSAFIDPQGRVVSATELFETDILRGTVRPSSGRTPYVGLGDLLPLLGAVVAVGLFLMPRRRIRARAPADPLPERPRVLVIVPTFDERATIERLITGVLDRDQDVAVLVVDDASPDGTAAIVRGLASADPRIRLLERPSKSGLASAYLEGFGLGLGEGFDLIVEMDADLSHDPGEFDRLLAGASRFDLTIGSRYVEGGAVTNWSRGRLALSRAGNLYARFMLGFPIHDATSGYRIYRKELLADVLARPIASEGYGFQVELALRSWRLGYRVGEVPITFRDRQHGTSKISRRIVVEALWLITVWGLSARFGHGEDLEPADEA
jgi:apolipoprotein N-acyltransferase